MLKVYFDTNILKFSATELRRLVPRKQSLRWGTLDLEVDVHDITTINPNDRIKNNPHLLKDANCLSSIAKLAKDNVISLVINHESDLESWNIPNMDSRSGIFYNAP